jgi:hypothetical protein
VATTRLSGHVPVTQFAVFFSDPAVIGLQRLDAPDAAAAEAMVLVQHPDAQVHAVDGSLVTDENRHPMLAAWEKECCQQRSSGTSSVNRC